MKRSSSATESTFVKHVPCDNCGSRDNAALYADGSTWCFGCETYASGSPSDDSPKPSNKVSGLLEGDYVSLPKRKLTEATCRKFGYTVGKHKGQPVQIATYKDDAGRPVAQKIRTRDKKFSIVGDAKAMTLFGQNLWTTGKKLVICEGEMDTMSCSQIQGHKWPTVGIPNGVSSAKKALLNSFDFLMNFEEIILMFDNDTAGIEAAEACAEVLPVGRVKIAKLPHKDVNDCLVAGDQSAVITAIFKAKDFRPDGIMSASELRSEISKADSMSPIQFPYTRLNEMTRGLQVPSLITLCAGSGTGKSTLVREIAYKCHTDGFKVGMMMLEETTKRTAQGLVGLHMNKNIVLDPEASSAEDIEAAYDDLLKDQEFFLFDHFGSTSLDTIINRIHYMKHALGCEVIFLDHISILLSGLTGEVQDERRLTDSIVHRLRTECVQQLGICLVLVSHLRRPSGDQGHEMGARVSLSHLRSSHSIAQLSDLCLALQVDSEDPTSGVRDIIVLKSRWTGEVGPAGSVRYDRSTGRLLESSAAADCPF